MKYTRKARGGDPLFVQGKPWRLPTFSEMLGVREWRDPVAQQHANNLMSNKLFNIKKSKSSGNIPVNKEKIKNLAQSFATRIIRRGPNGKPYISMQNSNLIKKNLTKFSTNLGFAPQASPPPVKNLFGNPVYYDRANSSEISPQPGTNPWQIHVAPETGWHLRFTGGKLRTHTRKNKRNRAML
jgi:hypothetical protein